MEFTVCKQPMNFSREGAFMLQFVVRCQWETCTYFFVQRLDYLILQFFRSGVKGNVSLFFLELEPDADTYLERSIKTGVSEGHKCIRRT